MKKDNTKKEIPQEIELPQSIIDSFARFLVPEIRKYYDSEEGRKEFAEWQKQQKDIRQTKGEDK